MGRKFANEIDGLQGTLEWASVTSVAAINEFIEEALGLMAPVLVVGSGGSFVMASVVAQLVTELGGWAKAVTPVGMVAERGIRSSYVVLVTARGNNNDAVNCYKYIAGVKPRSLLVLCLNEKSRVAREMTSTGFGLPALYKVPFGRDGFLAMNSIMATLGLLQQVFRCHVPHAPICGEVSTCDKFPDELVSVETVMAIGGVSTMPVATDLMVKCAETGLANVQASDFRTFVHGRHNWVARHGDETGVMAFVTGGEQRRADSVLSKLGRVPKMLIASRYEGFPALVDLFPRMFCLVGVMGDACGIDPGRPHIEDFGVKMYHTSCSFGALAKSTLPKAESVPPE